MCALLISASCKTDPGAGSTVESSIDMVLEHQDNTRVQFPDLYDSLATEIAEDGRETLILTRSLQKRGFTIADRGRGNLPPLGPRIVSVTLKKGDCFCEVNKMYYATTSEGVYLLTESIRCADSMRFYAVE